MAYLKTLLWHPLKEMEGTQWGGNAVTHLKNKTGYLLNEGARGDVVVKALRHKPAGRGFDS